MRALRKGMAWRRTRKTRKEVRDTLKRAQEKRRRLKAQIDGKRKGNKDERQREGQGRRGSEEEKGIREQKRTRKRGRSQEKQHERRRNERKKRDIAGEEKGGGVRETG